MKLQEIKEIIENYTGVDFCRRTHRRDLADIRSIFIYCAFRYADEFKSYHKLGEFLNRDHSTVVATRKRFYDLYDRDDDFTNQANIIINLVKTTKENEPKISISIDDMNYLDLRRQYLKKCKSANYYKTKYDELKRKHDKILSIELQKVS